MKKIIVVLFLMVITCNTLQVNASTTEYEFCTLDIVSTERVNDWSMPIIKVTYEMPTIDGGFRQTYMLVENDMPWEEADQMQCILHKFYYMTPQDGLVEDYEIETCYPLL